MPVRVLMHIDAPIGRVFDAVSDHESFLRSDGTTAKVIREGSTERNGLGCLREVRAGRRVRYLEEITEWERPSAFEYTIREASMPLRHLGSRMAFTSSGDGTDVVWTANFEIPVPILGRILRGWLERRLASAFTTMLCGAKGRLEAATLRRES